MKKLYVLYKRGIARPETGAAVLSFMQPDDEHREALACPKLFYGRGEMDAAREDVRKRYVGIVSRIAATKCGGRTLREALELPGRGNAWWYHRVSEKQVENDAAFNMLLQIFTILHVAGREGASEIVVCGCPGEVADVLKSRYKTTAMRTCVDRKMSLLRALLARVKYLVSAVRVVRQIQRAVSIPAAMPDVVFQGFWDWSVRKERKDRQVDDRYFKSLPATLRDKGLQCAWFVWFDHSFQKGASRRLADDAFRDAADDPCLIFLQKFLKAGDVVSAAFELRPFFRYLSFCRSAAFKALFQEGGVDLRPLFQQRLLYGFCDSSLPHSFLMETACSRAFARYKPRLSFSFLEFYVNARIFNQGAISGSPKTIRCDMQHASYGREKTFILADSDREICGNPDARPMPLPDTFFVMGELCRDILVENGISPEKIFITGSARFDHLCLDRSVSLQRKRSGQAKVLVVATLNTALDFEMVQAAFLAAEGLDIRLSLRSHPFAKLEGLRAYKNYSAAFTSSVVSLEDDLDSADLILFTYSSVAEEALLRGVPVLRWQASGFNGSVFRDLGGVPSAHSVESLRQQFGRFLKDRSLFGAGAELRETVLRKCFYKTDGMASCRIADKATELLRRT